MTQPLDDYAFHIRLDVPYDEALTRATAALREEGFGVITEVDIRQALREKIGVESRKYAILGACNPSLANRALTVEPEIGLLLPCNVIVYEDEDGSGTKVSIVDPVGMIGPMDVPELRSVADEAHAGLSRVAAALEDTNRA